MKRSYDLIIIGGGATGAGLALDASLRGYKTLLVEKYDFAYGTSSKSTKLVHGGVRYLEKAILNLNINQFNLVKQGLKERFYFLNNASHLAKPLKILTPIYSYMQAFYIYTGLKIYGLIAGDKNIGHASFLSRKEALKASPFFKRDQLVGAVSYYDGTFNDSRMVVALLQSAQKLGCEIRNYHEVKGFIYENDQIRGVKLFDHIGQNNLEVFATQVINAAGSGVDQICKMNNKSHQNILQLTSGIHIVLSKQHLPLNDALLIPKTDDGRVIFIIPWQNHCLVGTTENDSSYAENPQALKKDIHYLLHHINSYFNIYITEQEITSTFCGLRPLLKVPKEVDSSNLVRDHKIFQSQSGLITIAGGKWTTYREMGEQTIDYAIKYGALDFKDNCKTHHYKLIGSQNEYSIQTLDEFNIEESIKISLLNLYGDQANELLKNSTKEELERIHPQTNFIKAEVRHAIQNEFVKYPNDFLMRRINLGRLNIKKAKESLSTVIDICKPLLNWSDEKTLDIYKSSLKELNEIL